jgi:phenol hydroxylase P1 protein
MARRCAAKFYAIAANPCPLYPFLVTAPLYCKQDIFIFYIQWLIFLLIGNTMKNTMLRKGLTIF